ncbi:DUF4279 domain-containing protein [Shewanella sp. Arc9-LZ]|uniref:DUF4279 domain-containing protein n=3 Tax=Shewanella TaxID=22 RepID=UPI001C2BFB31|nr:DUF4279 domain-containing protein [Shewanella sp. Arc9-LZ]
MCLKLTSQLCSPSKLGWDAQTARAPYLKRYADKSNPPMACNLTYATLRISSVEMSPDKITEVIGISPTLIRRIEPDSKYRHRREFNYWAFSTKELSNSTDNKEHIDIILNKLYGKQEQMDSLVKLKCSVDIFCFWNSTGQGGPSMDVNLMRKLVQFGLNISWDMYFDDESA